MASKDIKGKPKLGLIPYIAKEQIAYVREYGCKKYNDETGESYRDVGILDFLEAAERHISKYRDYHTSRGKDGNASLIDPESGLNHLSHAACSLVLAIALEDEDILTNLEQAEETLALFKNNPGQIGSIEEAAVIATRLSKSREGLNRLYPYDPKDFDDLAGEEFGGSDNDWDDEDKTIKDVLCEDCPACTIDQNSDECRKCIEDIIQESVLEQWKNGNDDVVVS